MMDEFHQRQRELGACRCKDCLATYPTKVPATLLGTAELQDASANWQDVTARWQESVLRMNLQRRLEKIDRDVGALAEDVRLLVAELRGDASKE